MRKRMQEFFKNNRGKTYTGTGLARTLGWERIKRWKDEEGEHVRKYPNTKAAVRLAKKCGAQVERGPKHERYYTITVR